MYLVTERIAQDVQIESRNVNSRKRMNHVQVTFIDE